MSKLGKFNNILFTIMASLLIITLIFVLIQIISELIPTKYPQPDNSIVSSEKANELVQQKKRSHVIKFDSIVLVDSLTSLYIIPISQIKLEELDDLPSPSQTSLNIEAIKIMDPDFSYYLGSGIINNIVIVDMKNEAKKIIYNNRTCIVEYNIFNINNRKVLFLLVCKTDTNNDGELNERDLLELEVYDFSNNSLSKISDKPQHIIDIDIVQKTKEIILTVGIDKNNDNKFDRSKEPVILEKVNLNTYKIEELLSTIITDKLQFILDGIN